MNNIYQWVSFGNSDRPFFLVRFAKQRMSPEEEP